MMIQLDRIYKYFRWLSLDIVLGAIFFLAFLERYYQVNLSIHVYFALGSAVWLIYTTDHLMDGASLANPSSDRHRFHKRYFKWLISAGGLVLILALVNVYFLEIDIVRNGAIVSACSVSYLLLVYFFRKLWVKEILVALVYSIGIYLAPISMVDSFSYLDVILIFQLSGVAFLNLLIFSFYDRHSDNKDGFNSLVLRLGDYRSRLSIVTCAMVIVLSCLVTGLGSPIQVLYLLMTAILLLVFLMPKLFNTSALYRTIGDGIFYLPGIFVLLL
ncbi:UbiA family prenyltransferase [Marinoscillum pacificum]|uniref:UbiA family prenyltransferase n=1 Tax=Marinoscillum pacificum TaxID=392723 RepID=UPI002157A2A8|nr:UbiA family prenyltransferase [Marinoscillum pacificum]